MEEKDNLEVYELGYHILPTVAEEDLPGEVARLHESLSEAGGTIVSEGAPQSRGLSYEIAKKSETKTLRYNRAYFGWIKFEIDRENIASIKKAVEGQDNVLRFIIIKTVKENTMHTAKAPIYSKKQDPEKIPTSQTEEPKQEISKEELDKSIDELVVN